MRQMKENSGAQNVAESTKSKSLATYNNKKNTKLKKMRHWNEYTY